MTDREVALRLLEKHCRLLAFPAFEGMVDRLAIRLALSTLGWQDRVRGDYPYYTPAWIEDLEDVGEDAARELAADYSEDITR